MFLNSGSEAIDGALKLARRVTGRPGIIAFRGGFHGRTYGATSVTTSNLNYRTGYEPLLPGVYFAPYPTAYPEFDGDEEAASRGEPRRSSARCWPRSSRRRWSARSSSSRSTARAATSRRRPRSCARCATLCDEHGILLIADEVQSGYGRTGRMWALRARRDRPRRRVRGQGDRQRPAAVGDRVAAASSRSAGVAARTARRTAGTRSPAPPAWRCSRRSATRTCSRTPSRAAPSSSPASARSPPRTTGSATSAGRG